VVVQADEFLPRSVVIVAPTSQSARAATFRPEIEIGDEPTRVLVEQLGAVDTSRFGKLVDPVAPAEQWEIDDALQLILALG
jgi:mRNA interferase MazF